MSVATATPLFSVSTVILFAVSNTLGEACDRLAIVSFWASTSSSMVDLYSSKIGSIISFALAAEKMLKDREENFNKVSLMRNNLLQGLKQEGVQYKIYGIGIPHILSVCMCDKVRGETLVHALEKCGVYVSTGSACSSTKHMNRTLESMGVNKNEILCANRISFSPYINFDAKIVAKIICEEINKLKDKKYE